jgi:hypothetical protein
MKKVLKHNQRGAVRTRNSRRAAWHRTCMSMSSFSDNKNVTGMKAGRACAGGACGQGWRQLVWGRGGEGGLGGQTLGTYGHMHGEAWHT